MPNRYVVLSSSDNPQYAFFLPLTAEIWHEAGWEPRVTLVKQGWRSSAQMHVLWSLIDLGWLDGGALPAATVAQVSRLYACCDTALNVDDILLTSDADMWLIDATYFEPCDHFKVWSLEKFTKAFMCYNAGTVAQWRDLMAPPFPSSQADSTRLAVTEGLKQCRSEAEVWGLDERILNNKLKNWSQLSHVEVIKRPLVGNNEVSCRLDRSNWPDCFTTNNFDGIIDVHLPRVKEGLTRDLMAQILPVFDFILPKKSEWARSYCDEFLKCIAADACVDRASVLIGRSGS